MDDRLTVKLQREPLPPIEVADGNIRLAEQRNALRIEGPASVIFVDKDQVQDLAYALLNYHAEIEADRQRYVRLRERLGRSIRNGSLEGFDRARIEIETTEVR